MGRGFRTGVQSSERGAWRASVGEVMQGQWRGGGSAFLSLLALGEPHGEGGQVFRAGSGYERAPLRYAWWWGG